MNKPASSRDRMRSYRERQRASGRRLMQRWVLDLSNPDVLAEIKRESAILDRHPENKEIDDWIESVVDWDDWK